MTSTTEELSDDVISERLAGFIGRRDVGPAIRAREPISTTTIRQLTDVLGDRNPAYTDEDFASKSVHAGIVVPPTALQVFSLPGLMPMPGRHLRSPDGINRFVLAPGGQTVPGDNGQRVLLDDVHDLLTAAGYTSPAATNGWYEYKRYLRPGDHLSFSAPSVEECFGPKQTALGKGYFVTFSQDVTDQNDDLVATMRHRFIRFRPGVGDSARPADLPSPNPWRAPMAELGDYTIAPPPRTDTLRLGDMAIGDELPKLVIELTPTLIIATAIATQDYQNVHHDRDLVQRLGHPDVFMNILTSTGFVGRFVTDWAGPEALIEAVSIRLGVPNYPYDDFTISGRVAERDDDAGRVVVDIEGTNSIGTHLNSRVTLALPR